jgi:hydroxyethylthiazole kinase-like sugar kinase family protein
VSGRKQPEEGARVQWTTVDGEVRTGTVDLVMPGQFAVVVDEEFWIYRRMVGTGNEVPTGTRAIIGNNEDWSLL